MKKIKALLSAIYEVFASLELTIAGLGALMLLVFLCTIAEAQLGIFEAVKIHFDSWFLYSSPIHGFRFPLFPAGKLVGALLIVNLLCAHFKRFTLSFKKTGLWLVHFGLIILFVGQFLAGALSRETQMPLRVGKARDYSEDPRHAELALIDATNSHYDQVEVVPQALLKKNGRFNDASNDLTLIIRHYTSDAAVDILKTPPNPHSLPRPRGPGKNLKIIQIPQSNEEDQPNEPAAVVEVLNKERSIGEWTMSAMIPLPQRLPIRGKEIYIVLRPARYYEPFSLTLKKFTHKIYPGTSIPSKFSSWVSLKGSKSLAEDRDVLISMNHPLRFQGLTFYQASFMDNDAVSILEVVKNPSWPLPYVSSSLIALGLIIHFLTRLKKSRAVV